MGNVDLETKGRAQEYVRKHQLQIVEELGSGYDGVVYIADVKYGNIEFGENE